MPISDFMRRLRERVGNDLLVLPAVTGLIFDEARRVLLVRPVEADVWLLPGGLVEPNEVPADALVRELWEETGLVTRPRRLVGVFGGPAYEVAYPNGDRSTYVTTAIECDVVSGHLHARDGELAAFRWTARAELGAIAIGPWVGEVLAAAWDQTAPATFAAARWSPDDTEGRAG
jgi:ADP-ribose pyrophosphatase YjhB (NUDIX family)